MMLGIVKRKTVAGLAGALFLLIAMPAAQADDDLTKAPTPPLALQAWGDGETIHLSWQEPTSSMGGPILGYRVYGWGGELPSEVGDVSEQVFQDDPEEIAGPLSDLGWYAYYVTAYNEFGESLPSNPVVVSKDYPHCQPLKPEPLFVNDGCLWP